MQIHQVDSNNLEEKLIQRLITNIRMTPRDRLIKTLNHEIPDRLCVDLGIDGQTGIRTSALHPVQFRLYCFIYFR